MRGSHDAVRSAAGAAVQALFDRALREPVTPETDKVTFTGGGTGSGKSTVLGNLPSGRIALDTTMADYDATKNNVDKALGSGRFVELDFVYRDPIDAFVNGVLARANDPQDGRPVTVATHASTHMKAPQTFLRLAEDYATDFLVSPRVIDNTVHGAPVVRSLEWLRQQAGRYTDVHALRRDLETALAASVAAGRTSAAVARRLGAVQADAGRGYGSDAREPEARRGEQSPQGRVAPLPADRGTGGDQDALIADLEARVGDDTAPMAASGHATRAAIDRIYTDGPATPWSPKRPVSEHETVQRLRDVFSVDRITPTYLKSIFGAARVPYPMRVGRLGTKRALGLYYRDTGLIRLNRAFDLSTFAHEIGHMIDLRLFGKKKPFGLYRQEIIDLDASSTPQAKMNDQAYRFKEGIAEYCRIWFADPAHARSIAPTG